MATRHVAVDGTDTHALMGLSGQTKAEHGSADGGAEHGRELGTCPLGSLELEVPPRASDTHFLQPLVPLLSGGAWTASARVLEEGWRAP